MPRNPANPARWAARGLALVIMLPLAGVPLGRDQANWLAVAMALQDGAVMYRDVAVVNTPGLGILFAIVNVLTGRPELTPWIVHVLSVLSVVWAAYHWIDSIAGRGAAAGAAVVTALLWPWTMDWWDLAQKDGVAFAFAVMALAAMAHPSRSPVSAVLSGALLAAAVLTKTSAVVYALPVAVQLAILPGGWRGFLSRGLWTAAGGVAALSLPALYLSYHAAWDDALASLVGRASAYGGFARVEGELIGIRLVAWVLKSSVWILVPVLLLYPRPPAERWLLAATALVAITLLQFWAPGRGWLYHAIPVSGALLILFGSLAGRVAFSGEGRSQTIARALVLAAAVHAIYTHHERWILHAAYTAGQLPQEAYDSIFRANDMGRPDEMRAVAAWIKENTGADDMIVVWGMESQIYVLSDRLFPGPSFADGPIWHPELAKVRPDYFNTQRARFHAALLASPPAVFVVARNDANPVEPTPSDVSLAGLPEITAFLAANYSVVMTTDHYIVHARN